MSEKTVKSSKKTIHTTLSEESSEILDKFADLTDKNNQKIFGNKSKVLEKALELLDKSYNPQNKDDLQAIWDRARNELNMVLVGKTTYLAYISGDYEKAFEENIAIDILEWYSRMSIEDMNLSELLEAIKNVWLAANYFYQIEIELGSKGSYQISFYHDLHSKKYSEFWGNYFSKLLHDQKKCDIEIFPRSSSLILRISPP
ncbi:MAG: hypothetical protein ACFFBP_09620 [Promethearchaeota archaeon]